MARRSASASRKAGGARGAGGARPPPGGPARRRAVRALRPGGDAVPPASPRPPRAPAREWKPPSQSVAEGRAGGARHRQEADLAGAAGGTSAQGAVEDDGGAGAVCRARAGRRCPGRGRRRRAARRGRRGWSRSRPERGPRAAAPGGRRPGCGARRAARRSRGVRRWRGRSARARRCRRCAAGPAPAVRRARAEARLLRRPFHQSDRLLHRRAGPGVAVDGHRRLGEHRAEQVGDDHGDALGADVQGGQMGAVGDDPVQPGVRARAAARPTPRRP